MDPGGYHDGIAGRPAVPPHQPHRRDPRHRGPATITVLVYYLLIDGNRIREWLLRYDDDAIVRKYLEAVDRELEAVLFGNMLNLVVTSFIAIGFY